MQFAAFHLQSKSSRAQRDRDDTLKHVIRRGAQKPGQRTLEQSLVSLCCREPDEHIHIG